MKTLPIVFLAMTVALVSSGTTVFLLTSDFFDKTAFKERWMLSEQPTPVPPAVPILTVIDQSRNVLTIEEQKQLFDGIGDRFNDPGSAQVRRLVRSTTHTNGPNY
jgi:hypothetical protein